MRSRLQLTFGILLFVLVGRGLPCARGADTRSARELHLEPTDQQRNPRVPIKVYFAADNHPQPVVLFWHWLGGSRDNNLYLGKHWAAAGYVAVFLQHPGSDSDQWKAPRLGRRLAAFKAAASAQSLRDRVADVSFMIDQLERWSRQQSHPLYGRLDLEHIGMSGHSFGAITTLAVAGRKYPGQASFVEPRIDAFVAVSPNPGKGMDAAKAFGHLKKPMLCMTGTLDRSPIDPTLNPRTRRQVFEALPKGDKYQLVLADADHFAFSDRQGLRAKRRNPQHHPAIQLVTLCFWDAYLKQDKGAQAWLQSKQLLSDSRLSDADQWEWK